MSGSIGHILQRHDGGPKNTADKRCLANSIRINGKTGERKADHQNGKEKAVLDTYPPFALQSLPLLIRQLLILTLCFDSGFPSFFFKALRAPYNGIIRERTYFYLGRP